MNGCGPQAGTPKLPGYLSPDYGRSFAPFGPIVTLPQSGLQLLQRPIGNGQFDLTGLYPYSMCPNWCKLALDMDFLHNSGAVSVVFVGDPFETPKIADHLVNWHLCRPFKTHFIVDLQTNWRQLLPKETRRNSRRALELQSIKTVTSDPAYAPDLWALYQTTISRFKLTGIQRLSPEVIQAQLAIEGSVLVLGRDDTGITGAMTAFCHGATANAHIEFLAPDAHAKKTSYGLLFTMLEELERLGCRYVNLGGSAGVEDTPDDGLTQFKKRWAKTQRSALICGKILNSSAYSALCKQTPSGVSSFFPAYRIPGGPFEWHVQNDPTE
jgi:hypothetical protein